MKIASTLPALWQPRPLPAAAGKEQRPQPLTRPTRASRDRRYELALALGGPTQRRGRLLDIEA